MMEVADTNGDGRVDLDEFLQIFKSLPLFVNVCTYKMSNYHINELLTPLLWEALLSIVVKQMLYSWMIDGYKLLKSNNRINLS